MSGTGVTSLAFDKYNYSGQVSNTLTLVNDLRSSWGMVKGFPSASFFLEFSDVVHFRLIAACHGHGQSNVFCF